MAHRYMPEELAIMEGDCEDRYSGKFKLKKHEDVFDGFARWLKDEGDW